MPAKSGTRRPELLVRRGAEKIDDIECYVVGLKPLPYGEHILDPGTEVPGAEDWTRIEAWVSARRVRPIKTGEPYVSFEEYLERKEHAKHVAEVAGRPVLEDDEPEE